MKKILLGIIALHVFIACHSQQISNAYKIEGTIKGAKNGDYIFLTHERKRDSIKITNEKFTFSYMLEFPGIVFLIPQEGGLVLRMFVEPGDVKVTGKAGELAKSTLEGNGIKEWNYYRNFSKPYEEKASIARDKMVNREQLTEEDIAAMNLAKTKDREAMIETIKTRPDSPLSGFLLSTYFTAQSDYSIGKELYNGLGEKGKQSPYAIQYKASLEQQGKLEGSKGNPAAAFTLTDKDGKNISLSDYKGKYVVLDFWGSWCGPCRRSHPHLVEMYNKYKDKNFDMIGLANEKTDNPEKWLDAIKVDGLIWKQANLKTNEEGQSVLKNYNVKAFPTKILVDPNGNIVSFYVGDTKDIDDKLKEIFGE